MVEFDFKFDLQQFDLEYILFLFFSKDRLQ